MSQDDLIDALSSSILTDVDDNRFYVNSAGKLHRLGGPALLHYTGSRVWHQNGLRHRTDGPAIEWGDGTREWYLQGVRYTKFEYHAALKTLGIKT